MAHILRHLIRAGAYLLLCWQVSLFAQTAAPKESLAFTVYAVGQSPAWDKLYYLTGPKDAVKLSFRGNSRSAVLKAASAAKPLVFGVEQVDPATQQITYVPVAEAQWPDKAVKALLVFTAGSGPTGPQVQVTAVDDGTKAFPLRSVRIFNATGVPLMAKVGEFEGTVTPGMSVSYPYHVQSEDPNKVGSFPLAFAFNDPAKGPILLHNGYAEAWPLGRALVFVLPPPQPGVMAVQLRTLVDAPVVPKS
ncbi:MAG: hypothetical protein WC205_14050 [Opitutaceae bacterium]|jgi:hypothetical protein